MTKQMIRIEIDKCWFCSKKVEEGERIICPDGESKKGDDKILPPEQLIIPREWITTRRLEKITWSEWRLLHQDKGFQPKVLYEIAALCLECYQRFGNCEDCDEEFTPLYYKERLPDGRYFKKRICDACIELILNDYIWSMEEKLGCRVQYVGEW